MTAFFISDLHLTPKRPHSTELFFSFLSSITSDADALYILGDLFEFWLGDDAADFTGQSNILDALKNTTGAGVPVYFMHGNRDFLVGEQFMAKTGCRILPDPTEISLDETKLLLMHGDSMCTDDVTHQQFRAAVNNPDWQREFLGYSIEKRLDIALNGAITQRGA